MELKLKEFEVRFTVKMEDLDETFQSIVRRQNNTERLVNVQHEESVKLIEKKSRELHNGIVKPAQESIKEVEGKLESRNDAVKMAFMDISLHIDNMQAFSIKECEKLDQIKDMNGMAKVDIEKMFDETEIQTEERFNNIQKKIEKLKVSLENAQEKMYDHEFNKKNNLIFYGVQQEERETPPKLLAKVLDLIHVKLNIKREISITCVSRMYAGPEVHGCRPVLVTFEDFNEREEVLTKSKVLKESGITITQDISKKIREARQELKKFLRIVKRNSPDKYCFLQYDKLFVAGKVFVFDESEGKVVEQTNTDVGMERYADFVESKIIKDSIVYNYLAGQ